MKEYELNITQPMMPSLTDLQYTPPRGGFRYCLAHLDGGLTHSSPQWWSVSLFSFL